MGLQAVPKDPEAYETPRIYVEPPLPTATEFSTVEQVRAVIAQQGVGNFRMPALLHERMQWNPRLRATTNTRLGGLIATKIRWKPAKNNRFARRAARELEQDWPLMMAAPFRKQMLRPAIFLGAGIGQRVPDISPLSGRTIFRLRPYWTGFAQWYYPTASYRIQTMDVGVTGAPTPSLQPAPERPGDFARSMWMGPTPGPNESAWVVCEPFGVNSFREAFIFAAWAPWLGHDRAQRNQNRKCDKDGVGAAKVYYPRGEGEQHKAAVNRFVNGVRTMGSEGAIPCERRDNDVPGEPAFDVKPFEFSVSGNTVIGDTLNANAVSLAILLLGHNMTTEIKGGGSYASASVGEYIRDDVKVEDTETERSYVVPQILLPWTIVNYGDPEICPVPEYVTDSPRVNLARAQMLNYVAQAIQTLRSNLPAADLEALAEQYEVPLLATNGNAQVGASGTAPMDDMTDPAEQPEDAAMNSDGEGSEAATFAVGDRVTVRPGMEHDPAHAGVIGTISEVRGDTYAVLFDGTSEPHRWYTGDELTEADGDAMPDATDITDQEPSAHGTTPSAAEDATLALTPTHIAAIVKVDEGRKALKLTPVGGDVGGKWIQEHASEIAAEAPLDAAPTKDPTE